MKTLLRKSADQFLKFFNIFRTKAVIGRILFTLLIVFVFELGVYLPLPGVNGGKMGFLASNMFFQQMNLAAGGALDQFGLFALGTGPYVNASIITQLLVVLIPKYEMYSKSGQWGQQKLAQRTRIFTLFFGAAEAVAMLTIFKQWSAFNMLTGMTRVDKILIIAIVTFMSVIVSYLGELINDRGIGNGISILITAGIMVDFIPKVYYTAIQTPRAAFAGKKINWQVLSNASIMIAVCAAVILLTIWATLTEKRLPLQSAQLKVRTKAHYLPIKLMAGSMIPVIFASSIFGALGVAGQLMHVKWLQLNYNSDWTAMAIYGAMILIFAMFYNVTQLNPEQIQDGFEKSNTYIIGVPVTKTADYVTSQILRISLLGAPVLAVIVMTPIVIGKAWKAWDAQISGTNLLIMVAVIVEFATEIHGLTAKYHYKHLL